MTRISFLKSFLALPFVAALLSFNKKREKTIFTPEMLQRYNYGLFIINTKATDITKNPGYAATVSYKLTWQMERQQTKITGKVATGITKYGMVNFLTDGWVYPIGDTYEEVCEYLNNNPYGETFRLMTKEEVTYLINNRKQGFLD